MRYDFTDWSIELPEGWDFKADESCTTFAGRQGIGVLQVSSYRKDALVTDADLKEFGGDNLLAHISIGRLTGFCSRFSAGGTFWTKWFLRSGRQTIYVTYNCAVDERGSEEAEVNAMLETLTPKYCNGEPI